MSFQLRTPFTALLDEDLEEILRISGFDLGGYRVSFLKAKWGKRFALPHMHQAQLGLLYDTPRKGARLKALQTAFGRLTAILDVWWFHPEMGGFAKVSEIVVVHAKQKMKSVKKNRTQESNKKRTPVVAICGGKPFFWSSCVASDIKITDKDDGSVCPSLSCDARRCAA